MNGNEAKYVFSWNNGEIVEIHTEESFKKQYNKKVNPELYERSFLESDDNSTCIMDDLFDNNELCNEEIRCYDNMFVVRL